LIYTTPKEQTVNREQFLKARETKIVSVDVPEFGVVKMRELPESMRVREFDLWLRPGDKVNKQRQQDARLKIVSLCVVGDDGQPYLTEDDFPTMRQMPSSVVTRLADVAMSLAGLSDEDIGDKLKKTSGD
jgi:hypothetical protein